jgi:hypothetical protein
MIMASVPIYDANGFITGYQEIDDPSIDSSGKITPFQLDYYRNKVIEFQNVLTQLDASAMQARFLIDEIYDVDPELTAELQDFLFQYDQKKGQFRTAAEALNFAINGANQIGANFPILKIPSGLGFVPLAAGAAIAGALAVAAGLIVWGREWIAGLNDRLKVKQILESVPPEKRDAVAEAILKIDAAQKAADSSPLSSIANIVKWVGIAAVAYFALQAYQEYQK